MAGLIAPQFIDELLTRIDIVDVIEARVPLKKAGREWTACCPFHDERTASFTVSPQKQFYHCFGCGAHGSAIGFLMNYEHLEFPDAVEELAQSVGLEVVYEKGSGKPRANYQEIYTLLDRVTAWYSSQLTHDASVKAYCRQRGIDLDALQGFHIGWAPAGWDKLLQTFGTDKFQREQLDKAGLLSHNDKGRYYDRFRARLMFPIMDRRGRVIAFGGRVIDGEQSPKYLNSPETAVFHKGRELFGLWQAKQAQTRLQQLLVVEGYMDVIALFQAGLPMAVATLGTATTPEHVERLFRTVNDVIFCFDGDRAGRDAAWKALEVSLPQLRDGRQARFLILPEGEDPDSIIQREGKVGFEARMQQATALSTYFFEHLSHGVDLTVLDGRARLAERAQPYIRQIPAGAFRELMQQELERLSGVQAVGQSNVPATSTARQHTTRRQPSLVRTAIRLLINQPALAQTVEPASEWAQLDVPGMPLLLELMAACRDTDDLNTARLLARFRAHRHYASLTKLAARSGVDKLDVQQEFNGAMQQLARQAREQQRERQVADLLERQRQDGLTDAEKQQLRTLLQQKAAPSS